LVLKPGSEAFTELDILKSSNYTLFARTNICESCASLKLSIEGEAGESIIDASNTSENDSSIGNNHNISNSPSKLEWFHLDDIYLKHGRYRIEVYSDSQRVLDSLVIYSSSNHNNNDSGYKILDDIFSISTAPSYITEYEKIDPTRYNIHIRNATKPYVLSFAESYDPLWTASVTGTDGGDNVDVNNSIPLYSITNGFYIDRMGD